MKPEWTSGDKVKLPGASTSATTNRCGLPKAQGCAGDVSDAMILFKL
jgi:hypothetical protein